VRGCSVLRPEGQLEEAEQGPTPSGFPLASWHSHVEGEGRRRVEGQLFNLFFFSPYKCDKHLPFVTRSAGECPHDS